MKNFDDMVINGYSRIAIQHLIETLQKKAWYYYDQLAKTHSDPDLLALEEFSNKESLLIGMLTNWMGLMSRPRFVNFLELQSFFEQAIMLMVDLTPKE